MAMTICVNYEDILGDVLVPGLRFRATVNGVLAAATVELLDVIASPPSGIRSLRELCVAKIIAAKSAIPEQLG